MNANTGIGLVIGVLVYFALLFVFFSQTPPELVYGHSMSGVQFNTPGSVNSTITSEDVSALQIFAEFSSFRIEGIPGWLTIIAVYVPIIMLLVGIYGLVRGI